MYTWEELEQFVNNCRACPLCRTRKHPVMGRGDHKGKLMLVAEAPGSQEDMAGIPFVGPSGKVLDELLAAAQRLIDPDYRISRQHGTWIERRGCFLTATYHPSALLRDPSRMEEAKRDFQGIGEKLLRLERAENGR